MRLSSESASESSAGGSVNEGVNGGVNEDVNEAAGANVEAREGAAERGFDQQAGHAARQRADVLTAGGDRLERAIVDDGDRDRHVLDVFLAPLRGDDDVAEAFGRIGIILRRVLRGGRHGDPAAQQRGCREEKMSAIEHWKHSRPKWKPAAGDPFDPAFRRARPRGALLSGIRAGQCAYCANAKKPHAL